MSRTAKCSNYQDCIIAYRNETVTLGDDAEPVCPECGKPLKVVSGNGAGGAKQKVLLVMLAFLVLLAAILGIGFWISISRLAPSGGTDESIIEPSNEGGVDAQIEVTPAATAEEKESVSPEPAITPPEAIPVPEVGNVPEAVTVPESINLDVQSAVNQQVKEEVLKRIDLMPTISPDDKDQLYVSVERARHMGRMITIPFDFGNKSLSSEDISHLKAALKEPQVESVLADPTAVFVVLGYADTKGDPEKNLKISLDRANVVLSALRDIGVLNVMHSVGMGGSTMFDEEGLEKNRVVEVWAVLP